MKISVIGTGYVGLVTGTCFAETGNDVTCVDIDSEKVKKLSGGQVTIYEPGLETLFDRNLKQGRLHFTTDLAKGISGAKVIFLALPTPPGADGQADLQYVLQVAKNLGPLLSDYTVIVDKSTVPVGTAELVRKAIADTCQIEFDVVSNPEFLREGVAVDDFMKPERVVIGTDSPKAQKIMSTLYSPFVRQGNPLIYMDERSAELTKYAANAFLATKITFMNEIANLCELVGADVDAVRKGIGTDSRIGKRFLFAGIGYGGSCFPKDVQALSHSSKKAEYDFQILDAVMAVNSLQKARMFDKLSSHYNGALEGRTVAMWGLSFKPSTDDVREAPAIENIKALLEAGAKVKVFDPEAIENIRAIFGDRIIYGNDQYEVLDKADALMVMTEWPVFRTPDLAMMRELMSEPLIFDGRNLYDLDSMQEAGFTYYSIGRKKVNGK